MDYYAKIDSERARAADRQEQVEALEHDLKCGAIDWEHYVRNRKDIAMDHMYDVWEAEYGTHVALRASLFMMNDENLAGDDAIERAVAEGEMGEGIRLAMEVGNAH